MRAGDGYSYSSSTATSSPTFTLGGGMYVVDAVATWNAGSITLQRLGPDGTTYLTAATAFSANGTSGVLYLPPATYKIAVTSATALAVNVMRVPGE